LPAAASSGGHGGAGGRVINVRQHVCVCGPVGSLACVLVAKLARAPLYTWLDCT
jgi:hypothetical protein